MKFKSAVVCALVAFTTLQTPRAARALKFHADLSSIRVEGRPGQSFNHTFTLTLEKDELKTRFKVHTEDWWRSEDGKQSFYVEPGKVAHSCAGWVKLNPVESEVAPGDTLQVRVSAAIPGDAKPGGYWCALTVDEQPDPLRPKPQGVGAIFLASVSVKIYINVTPVDRKAHAIELQATPRRAAVKLVNDGNCPLLVRGRFEFLKPGKTTPLVVIEANQNVLLPEPVNCAWIDCDIPQDKQLAPGTYIVRAILDVGVAKLIGAQRLVEVVDPAAAELHGASLAKESTKDGAAKAP